MTTHIFESSDCVAKLTADIFVFVFVFLFFSKINEVTRIFDSGDVVGKRRKQEVDKMGGIIDPNL